MIDLNSISLRHSALLGVPGNETHGIDVERDDHGFRGWYVRRQN